MARPDPLAQPANDFDNRGPAARKARQARRGGRRLTRGQRLLAALMAAAVLVSGLNALVQVARVLVEWEVRR